MHHLRLNIRITMLAVAVAAVLLAGSLGQPPRQAEAGIAFTDVNGVICGYLHTLTGAPVPLPNFQGTTLARIDHDTVTQDVTVTAVAYTDAAGALAMPNCKTAQAPIPAGATAPAADETRPSVIDLTYANNKISGGSCQADFSFGGITMAGGTLVSLQLNLSKNEPTVQSIGSFTFENIYTDGTCTTEGGGLGTIKVQFDALYMAGPTIGTAVDSSNWDKDGGGATGSARCSDWNELDPSPLANHYDPFKTGDCPLTGGVGGVAELAEAAGTPLDAPDSSGTSAGLIAGVLAAVAAGVVALGGAAWYAKRRL